MQKALTIHFCHFDSLSVIAWRTRLLNSFRSKILPELGLLRLHPWVDSRVTYLHTFYSQRFRRSKCPQEKIDPWSVDLILKNKDPVMKYVLPLLAICLSFHFASRVEAGEPLILEGNTSLNLPKNKLNPDALGNALAPGTVSYTHLRAHET